MDAHFREYLAAIAGMEEMYGENADHQPTEFHDDSPPATAATEEAALPVASTWDA